jgi:hypothetical protein
MGITTQSMGLYVTEDREVVLGALSQRGLLEVTLARTCQELDTYRITVDGLDALAEAG